TKAQTCWTLGSFSVLEGPDKHDNYKLNFPPIMQGIHPWIHRSHLSVRRTAPRRMRGPSYATLEAHTSRKDKATPPSSPDVGTIGHQLSPGKLRPLTKNLRIGTYLVTPYTSRPSVRPVPVRRIYERRPSGTLCKWKQLNRSM